MKKVLWASRHALDPAAETDLFNLLRGTDAGVAVEIVQQEILWPSDKYACREWARKLHQQYDVIAGVFPAQAIEALRYANEVFVDSNGEAIYKQIISPVSVPETEPDVKKVRPFRFVRWAWVA